MSMFTDDFIKNYKDSEQGYALVEDVEYTCNLHPLNKDIRFFSEKK